ncbi:MAG TPA: hypothetical protein VJ781_04950 [Pyrinomonadaceae bacterium]|nr:hypothetical protein [Pyrinomonadaceae bacterium]
MDRQSPISNGSSRAFFRLAAIAAFLSGLTTLAVHLLPRLYAGPNEFERLVGLHAEPIYILRLWIVLLHILLVVVSMLGVALRKLGDSPGLITLGFLGYLLFAAAELFRTAMGLAALNRSWRAAYVTATDEQVRSSLRTLIEGWQGINDGFFFLLILGFLIGNLFFGLVLVRGLGLEKIIGAALLVWTVLGLNTMIGYTEFSSLSVPEWISWTFQPAVRFLIAWWLWQTPTILIRPGREVSP